MALDQDGSSIVLLSVNGKPAENNNMLETDTFQTMEYGIKPDPVKVTKCARLPFILAWICVACAIAFTTAAVVLLVRYTGSNLEGNQTIPITSLSSTISPTPPTRSSTLSPSSVTIEPSFTQTYSSSSVGTPYSSSSVFSPSSVIQTSVSSLSVSSSSSYVTSPSKPVVTPSSTKSTSTTASITTNTTTASTAAPTTPKPCSSGEFRCHDGTCINNSFYCDGKPHCATSEDEPPNCKCTSSQFTCRSGQCISDHFRCDMVPQCMDKSDEFNCTNCNGFTCDSGQCLWANSVKCNGVVDCDDLSDETSCGSWKQYHERCKNGMWIPWGKWCDGVDDCFDNSDENDCSDDYYDDPRERMCGDSSASIPHEWWCDGHPDCPDQSDEQNCGTCGSEQFQCSDYACIDIKQVCDGKMDCKSGSDELGCVKLQASVQPGMVSLTASGVVMVTSNQQQLPVCSDNWSNKATDEICAYLGKGSGASQTYVSMTMAGISGSDGFMKLDGDGTGVTVNHTVLSLFSHSTQCTSRKVVAVTCSPLDCGSRKVELMTPFIVGGSMPPLGKWPWIVSLSLLGKYVCSGVLIDNNWILTAAHCVVTGDANYTLVPQYYTAVLGSISIKVPGSQSQFRTMDRIILHPNTVRLVTGVTDWDMALMHLSEPVQYSNYIQPVCLPSHDTVFPPNSQCYLAGWGYINPQQVVVDNLRDAKFRLWGDEDCKRNTVDQESQVNINSTLCAGYHSGLISACQGDSGGPLMCQVSGNRWVVAGVMSSGTHGCDGQQAFKANRFARVTSSIDWMHTVLNQR